MGRARGRGHASERGMARPRGVGGLTTLTPAQVDEQWAVVMGPINRALTDVLASESLIRRYRRRGHVPEYLTAQLQSRKTALEVARQAEVPFQEEFERRGGWPRYFLVANSNGHLHRSGCSTLHPGRTRVLPVFELSGADDAQVVARMGYVACTVCFPDAPVMTSSADSGYCPGSHTVPVGIDWRRLSVRCPVCGRSVALTNSGLRKHRPPHK